MKRHHVVYGLAWAAWLACFAMTVSVLTSATYTHNPVAIIIGCGLGLVTIGGAAWLLDVHHQHK